MKWGLDLLKVGIVGVGGMGSIHLQNWRKMDVSLAAICDKRFELAQERAIGDERCYHTLEEMLASEQLDILDVCTPTDCHKEQSIIAMDAGIHVLCEKPVALSVSDALEMLEAAERNNVKFMAAQVVRFMSDYIGLFELCKSGVYGKIVQANFWRLSPTPKWSSENWMMDEKRSGAVPFDLHIHDADFMVSLLGKPTAVSAVRTKPQNSSYPDYYTVRYEYPSAMVTAEASWYAGANPFQVGYRVMMQEAVVENIGGKVTIYKNDGTVIESGNAFPAENTGINLTSTDGYFEEQRYFKNCVLNDCKTDFIKKQDILDVIEIIAEGVNTSVVKYC